MSFLAPLFLLGALAVALPIVFHLIRRTSREKMPFSSLMFLLPTPPRVTRRSRLENIFLLILRCLVLCLLAAGFARPFLQTPVAADPQSGAGKKIVVLVDTSASMRRDNLWADARDRVENVLKKTSPADQVALFTFDRQVNRLVNFEQWRAMNPGERTALTSQRLAEIKPAWSSTHLGSALIAAAEALEESARREQSDKRIVLISDLQEGSRLEGLQGYEWPRGMEVMVEPLKARRPTNAGLQLVTDRDETEKLSVDGGPRIRVSNSANSRREQFQIGWARAGEKGFVGAAVDVYVPPGQSRVVQAPKAPAGLPEERLALAGDDDEFDNTVYLVPPKAEQIDVLFLGNDPEQDPAQSLYYLKRAFQQTRRQNVRIIARAAETPLLSTDADNAQLMIVSDVLTEERAKAVKKFLTDGKTVLLTMKTPAAAQTLGWLLGLESSPGVEEARTSGYAMLGQIDFQHPLFASFADPRYSDFTKIHFWKHRRLAPDKIPGARVVARFDSGDPALLEVAMAKGTLLVLTCGWQPADSQLALSSKFVPLLYAILELSGSIKAQLAQYFIDDEVPLGGAKQPATVRKPDGAEVKVAAGDRFSQTDQPGIYTISSIQPSLHFAVNLAPEESKTAPLPLEELEHLGVPLKSAPTENAKQAEQKRQNLQAAELEAKQKLWRWLLVAAVVVIMMETWLAARLTRGATIQTEAPI